MTRTKRSSYDSTHPPAAISAPRGTPSCGNRAALFSHSHEKGRMPGSPPSHESRPDRRRTSPLVERRNLCAAQAIEFSIAPAARMGGAGRFLRRKIPRKRPYARFAPISRKPSRSPPLPARTSAAHLLSLSSSISAPASQWPPLRFPRQALHRAQCRKPCFGAKPVDL